MRGRCTAPPNSGPSWNWPAPRTATSVPRLSPAYRSSRVREIVSVRVTTPATKHTPIVTARNVSR